ncbi:MAG: hypothetical protein O6932_00465 [Gammaproteobacteria bacterium]|nr:hypothetical protein [Gammaproteobacteria bacterium]
MQHQFRQPAVIFALTLLLYSLAIVAVTVYIDSLWLMVALVTLLVLWLATDRSRYRALQAQDPAGITLNDQTGGIELYQQGSQQQFTQFRLYANRWFLILQLKNGEVSKNLLLAPRGFSSIAEFLRFRYAIVNMNKKLKC